MKKLTSFITLSLLMSSPVLSYAMESCPRVEIINEVNSGVYRASGMDGEWIGVISGITDNKNPVQSFRMARAIKETDESPLKFQSCTYETKSGATLDMRFNSPHKTYFTIKTEADVWKEESSYFGMINSVCEKTVPENCKFSLN